MIDCRRYPRGTAGAEELRRVIVTGHQERLAGSIRPGEPTGKADLCRGAMELLTTEVTENRWHCGPQFWRAIDSPPSQPLRPAAPACLPSPRSEPEATTDVTIVGIAEPSLLRHVTEFDAPVSDSSEARVPRQKLTEARRPTSRSAVERPSRGARAVNVNIRSRLSDNRSRTDHRLDHPPISFGPEVQ